MAQRATVITLEIGVQRICAGEPMLDADEGVLIIQYEDGSHRTFNWDKVIDFYYLTEEETAQLRSEGGN